MQLPRQARDEHTETSPLTKAPTVFLSPLRPQRRHIYAARPSAPRRTARHTGGAAPSLRSSCCSPSARSSPASNASSMIFPATAAARRTGAENAFQISCPNASVPSLSWLPDRFVTRLKRISASINGSRFAFVSPHRMAPLLALSIGLTNLEFWISKRLVASHAKAIGTKSLSLSRFSTCVSSFKCIGFAKTGSGQTSGKRNKKGGRVFFSIRI